jgi:hypothetical protein
MVYLMALSVAETSNYRLFTNDEFGRVYEEAVIA